MPNVQVKDLLERVVKFHGMLREFYSRIDSESRKESVKLLVNYMARHEKILAERLEKITTQQQQELDEEWWTSVPVLAQKVCLQEYDIDQDSSIDDVIDAGLKLNQCLISYYSQLADISPSDELTEFFTVLEQMEIVEKTRLLETKGM
ncbi:MAG: hypothetical protein HN350_20820 [Phycisphaerales bacterium]|jgi:rubrerythrin|nr:hypothetical protein [Phycisphaerales bacterium]